MNPAALDQLRIVVWLGLMTVILAGAVVQYLVYRRVRSLHFSAWQALGSPTFSEYNGYIKAMGRFVWKNEYQSLDDSLLIGLALVVKSLSALALLTLVGGAILTFLPPASP